MKVTVDVQWSPTPHDIARAFAELDADGQCDMHHLRAVLREVALAHGPDLRDGNAPGHCHRRPGVWDDGNGPGRAGRRCRWCRVWREACAAAGVESGGSDVR
jgi:hypothetical protein